MNSLFGKLNKLDGLKSFLMAVGGGLVMALTNIFEKNIPIDFTWAFWQPVIWGALGTGLVYLAKNVFQNSQGVPFKPEPK
jgi:hypothetical protein